jgi:hypothetical protein
MITLVEPVLPRDFGDTSARTKIVPPVALAALLPLSLLAKPKFA